MKYVLLTLITIAPFFGLSQNIHEVNLSKKLNEKRVGIWTNGDFKICIELNPLEESFRYTGNSYLNAFIKKNVDGSVDTTYKITAERYLKAADQLKNAENGFDLRSLVIYFGKENEKENSGNSFIIENTVRHKLENGECIAFFKDERIYKIKKLHETEGHGLDFGYNVLIYFDDIKNVIFKYHQHIGW